MLGCHNWAYWVCVMPTFREVVLRRDSVCVGLHCTDRLLVKGSVVVSHSTGRRFRRDGHSHATHYCKECYARLYV
jgi:hypothetical protein